MGKWKIFNKEKELIQFESISKPHKILTTLSPAKMKDSFVMVYDQENKRKIIDKTFKSKAQALKYARSYMRNH